MRFKQFLEMDYPAQLPPLYSHSNYKSTGGRVTTMDPREFLRRVRPLDIDDSSRDNIDDLKRHILSGGRLDPLSITPNGKEDGRHRAHASIELGIKKVPVILWENTDDLAPLYRSLVDPNDLKRRERLNRLVQIAYERGDHKTAERLDAELEELEDRIDSRLEDMDDGNKDDDAGGEEQWIDMEWSPQEELARIYDQYVKGKLHLSDHEWEEVDPSYRNDPEFQRLQKSQGYAMAPKGAFHQKPITKHKALADMLRSAIWDAPQGQNKPKINMIKSMSDEEIIRVAKDAWEWKKSLKNRIMQAKPRG